MRFIFIVSAIALLLSSVGPSSAAPISAAPPSISFDLPFEPRDVSALLTRALAPLQLDHARNVLTKRSLDVYRQVRGFLPARFPVPQSFAGVAASSAKLRRRTRSMRKLSPYERRMVAIGRALDAHSLRPNAKRLDSNGSRIKMSVALRVRKAMNAAVKARKAMAEKAKRAKAAMKQRVKRASVAKDVQISSSKEAAEKKVKRDSTLTVIPLKKRTTAGSRR